MIKTSNKLLHGGTWMIVIFMSLGILLFSCNNGTETEQPEQTSPVIDSLYLNFSQNANTLFIAAKIFDMQDDIDSVNFHVYMKILDSLGLEEHLQSGLLYNDGTHGDIINNDTYFSYLVNDCVTEESRADSFGVEFRCIVQAHDSSGNSSDIVTKTKSAAKNSPPVLYLLDAPSTFEKGDTLKFEIRVSDPQGLDDILAVLYFIENPDGETQSLPSWLLRDDGKFGDETANDGIYTVWPTTKPSGESSIQGRFVFYFSALDQARASSDTLDVTVRNPGVSLTNPEGVDTLHIGGQVSIEWESAYIDTLQLQYTITSEREQPIWLNIAKFTSNTTSYSWTVPSGDSSDNCKIRIYDVEMPSRYDISNQKFCIMP